MVSLFSHIFFIHHNNNRKKYAGDCAWARVETDSFPTADSTVVLYAYADIQQLLQFIILELFTFSPLSIWEKNKKKFFASQLCFYINIDISLF